MYRAMSLHSVEKYVPLAKKLRVSVVARSKTGFLGQYKKVGSFRNLSPYWKIKRNNFIKRHLTQAKRNREPYYDKNGKLTRRTLALIMWAYNPVELKKN